MEGSMSYARLATEKYTNFLQRFKQRLVAAKLFDLLSSKTAMDIIRLAQNGECFWVYLRQRDVESLVALFEIADFGDKDAVLQQFRDLSVEEEALLWRYVDFFLDIAEQLKK